MPAAKSPKKQGFWQRLAIKLGCVPVYIPRVEFDSELGERTSRQQRIKAHRKQHGQTPSSPRANGMERKSRSWERGGAPGERGHSGCRPVELRTSVSLPRTGSPTAASTATSTIKAQRAPSSRTVTHPKVHCCAADDGGLADTEGEGRDSGHTPRTHAASSMDGSPRTAGPRPRPTSSCGGGRRTPLGLRERERERGRAAALAAEEARYGVSSMSDGESRGAGGLAVQYVSDYYASDPEATPPHTARWEGPQGPLSGQQGPLSGQQGAVSGQQGPVSGQQGPISGQQGPVSGQQGPASARQGPVFGQQGPASARQGHVSGPQPFAGDGAYSPARGGVHSPAGGRPSPLSGSPRGTISHLAPGASAGATSDATREQLAAAAVRMRPVLGLQHLPHHHLPTTGSLGRMASAPRSPGGPLARSPSNAGSHHPPPAYHRDASLPATPAEMRAALASPPSDTFPSPPQALYYPNAPHPLAAASLGPPAAAAAAASSRLQHMGSARSPAHRSVGGGMGAVAGAYAALHVAVPRSPEHSPALGHGAAHGYSPRGVGHEPPHGYSPRGVGHEPPHGYSPRGVGHDGGHTPGSRPGSARYAAQSAAREGMVSRQDSVAGLPLTPGRGGAAHGSLGSGLAPGPGSGGAPAGGPPTRTGSLSAGVPLMSSVMLASRKAAVAAGAGFGPGPQLMVGRMGSSSMTAGARV